MITTPLKNLLSCIEKILNQVTAHFVVFDAHVTSLFVYEDAVALRAPQVDSVCNHITHDGDITRLAANEESAASLSEPLSTTRFASKRLRCAAKTSGSLRNSTVLPILSYHVPSKHVVCILMADRNARCTIADELIRLKQAVLCANTQRAHPCHFTNYASANPRPLTSGARVKAMASTSGDGASSTTTSQLCDN